MIPTEWQPILARLIEREGGFVNDPLDAGGATNYGITLRNYRANVDENATVDDLRALTKDDAAAYYWKYWVVPKPLELHIFYPINVSELILDTAVLFGPWWATKWLQEAINEYSPDKIAVDGHIGPKTRDAFLRAGKFTRIARSIAMKRIQHHARRVQREPDQARFLVGWINRAKEWIL